MADYSGEYKVPWLAKLLHSFPHIDLTFQFTNSSFSYENPRYREALLFWGALPVLWLLVTLLVFLMYFCYRCCQKDASKKRAGSCLPWAMAILALLTGGVIGVGFYGNEETHKGVLKLATAGEDADITTHHMQTQFNELVRTVNKTIIPRLQNLNQLFIRHNELDYEEDELTRQARSSITHSSQILNAVSGIDTKAQHVHFAHLIRHLREYGYYRWVGTIVLLCWQVLLVLLLLFGIGKSSKCTLLMFCAFGIFTLVLCWVSAGIHLAASVGLGDFCISPDVYIAHYASTENIDKDIILYYIKCNIDVTNPFSMSLMNAMNSVASANKTINKAITTASGRIPDSELLPFTDPLYTGMAAAVHGVQQLTALVECNNLHRDYEHAIHGICYLGLPGIVFVLLSATAAGLLLTILVLLASCAWRHFGPRAYAERKEVTEMKGYREVDEDETFLPRNDNASPSYYRYGGSEPPGSCSDSLHEDTPATYPSQESDPRPFSYGFPRGRHSNPREHVPLKRRSSPPPAYSTNEFYRQYGDMSNDDPPSRAESRA